MSLRQSALHSNQPAFGHLTDQIQKKKSKFEGFKYPTYLQVMAHLKQGSHISFMSKSTNLLPEVQRALHTIWINNQSSTKPN